MFALLRTLGTESFSTEYFKQIYFEIGNKNINKSPEALLRYLYELGIISNIQFGKNGAGIYSIIRNEKSKYDPKMKTVVHSVIIKGLYTY